MSVKKPDENNAVRGRGAEHAWLQSCAAPGFDKLTQSFGKWKCLNSSQ